MIFDKQPQEYQPAYDPILFVISSTYSNVLYFNLNLNDQVLLGRIVNDKAYVSPVTPTSTHYNISDIARDLVKWEIVNDGSLSAKITDSVRKIQLVGSDNGVVGNTMSQLGTTASSTPFNVWNGFIPRHNFTNFNFNDYVLSTTSNLNPIKFLTTKPNYSIVNNYSRDFLYYLKKDDFLVHTLVFEKFSVTNASLGSFTANVSGYTSSMVRLDVSPKAIALTQPTFLSGASYYSVHLSSGGNRVSEKKYFKYIPEPTCGRDIVNIFWENYLGGIDSYQFIQPVESRSVERFSILKNPYQYDNSYAYSDSKQMVYNQEEEVIHTNMSSNWNMWTDILTSEQNRWIGGLVHSRNWWVELKNGRVYPCVLLETTYRIENQKYIVGDRLQSQWTWNFVNQIIENGEIYAGVSSIPTTTSTTTTTTTSASTTTTTTSSSTTTTSSSTTTTTTSGTIYEFTGSGRGSSTQNACDDATANNRTFYSNCSSISDGCYIYTDSGGTTALTGYTHIYIDNANWRISSSLGIIQYIDVNQC